MSKESISVAALLINVLLASVKIFVGLLSRSSAIVAEGIHSGMDVVSSGINYIGIRASRKPVDKEHPYGHHKSEVLAGFIITIFLLATAAWVIYEAVMGLLGPKSVDVSYLSMGVMLASAGVNEVMARVKSSAGKKEESVSLIADAMHSRVDVMTSLGVLTGLFLTGYWVYADSVAAMMIGAYIMWSSMKIGKQAMDSLLDVSAGEEVEARIRDVAGKENVVLSGLRTQKLGPYVFADLSIKLDSGLKVEDASRISKRLEEKLREAISGLKYVVIQIESHHIRESSYKGGFGMEMRWKGRMGGSGMGPGGECVCPRCGSTAPHQRGTPCFRQACPKCGARMARREMVKKK
jgi:cation diffusion facilitator family transporter